MEQNLREGENLLNAGFAVVSGKGGHPLPRQLKESRAEALPAPLPAPLRPRIHRRCDLHLTGAAAALCGLTWVCEVIAC